MTMRYYKVTLVSGGQTRQVRVPSPTDVQAGDAAAPLMRPDEAIQSIEEVEDAGRQTLDAAPPQTQAEELAPVTPGVAAVPSHRSGPQLQANLIESNGR